MNGTANETYIGKMIDKFRHSSPRPRYMQFITNVLEI